MSDRSSRLAGELGIANQFSAAVYMLYYTVRMCILRLRNSLNPTPVNVELRNDAALKIATCLELKEFEKREGLAESSTITTVATKVVWQALGDFDAPEGHRLAQAVQLSTQGNTFLSVETLPSDLHAEFFAQFVEAATSSTPAEHGHNYTPQDLSSHNSRPFEAGAGSMQVRAQD
jgi:hypothetical protein